MAQDQFKRKLTTILSAHVAGYSRLMGGDEAATVKTLEQYQETMSEFIRQHRGRGGSFPRGQSAREVKMFNELIGYPRNGRGFL